MKSNYKEVICWVNKCRFRFRGDFRRKLFFRFSICIYGGFVFIRFVLFIVWYFCREVKRRLMR